MRSILSLIRFSMIGTGLFLIGLGVLAIVFAPRLEPLAREYVEAQLSDSWQSTARVEHVGFSFWDRALELANVAVDSKPGAEKTPSLDFARVLVQPDLLSLFSGKPTIEEVRLEGGQVAVQATDSEGMTVEDLVEDLELPAKKPEQQRPSVSDWLMRSFSSDGTQVQVHTEEAQTAVAVKPYSVQIQEGAVSAQQLGQRFFQQLAAKLLTAENLKMVLDASSTDTSPSAATKPAE